MRFRNIVRYSLVALTAAMLVSKAQAATYDLNLTLDPSQFPASEQTQTFDGLFFDSFTASLGDPNGELAGLTVTQGDVIDTTITVLNGGTYTIPADAYRTDVLQYLSGSFPTDGGDSDTAVENATMTFLLGGNPVLSQSYSSSTSTELASFASFQPVPVPNSITFDTITDVFTIETLAGQDDANVGYTPETATITASSLQYSLVSQVPEPATWAMFLVGFGAIGFAMRGRKKIAAATA